MPEGYFHGVKHEFVDDAGRPITTQSDVSIFIVAVAPGALVDKVPLNKTVLISGSDDTDMIAALGTDGEGPEFVDTIFSQVNTRVFFHRIEEGADDAATLANVIGGIDGVTGKRHGLQAALDVKQNYAIDPSVLIAPGYSQNLGVATEIADLSKKLSAEFAIDGPNTDDADAITYRGNFDERHGYMVDPFITYLDADGNEASQASSALVAGVIAATPWWESVSNRTVRGLTGIARDVDYRGDGTSRAELLNKAGIGAIVRHPKGGWKLLGGRSMGNDPKFIFFKRARVMNVFARTIMDQMQWAVDKNITRRYFEAVTESMNKWIRREVALEHIAGGRCWVNPEVNTPDAMEAGQVVFDYDFVEYGEAEQVTFRMHINNGYLVDIVPV